MSVISTSPFRFDLCHKVFQEFLFCICSNCYLDLFSSLPSVSVISDMGPIKFSRSWGTPSSTFLYHSGCIISCLDILLHYLTFGSPTCLHWLYFLAPDVTPRVVQFFVLSHGALVLVLRGGAWQMACKADLVPFIKWMIVPISHLKMGKYSKSTLG